MTTEHDDSSNAPTTADTPFRTGFVAIVGRPNVGKSTLMNHLIGQKISITSDKAQTTRHRVHGIYTTAEGQWVFVDTPGFQTRHGGCLNEALNRSVTQTLQSVEVVLFVVEALRYNDGDAQVLALLPKNRPVILVVNKSDRAKDKYELAVFLREMSEKFVFHDILSVSARHGLALDPLREAVWPLLPEGVAMYPEDSITDRNERFLASEIVREKLFRYLSEELPYGMTVSIEKYEEVGSLRRIFAAILVDRESHKAMLIGKQGDKLKRIASEARVDMEKLFDGKVYLEVWVKVKSGWSDDVRVLRQMGFE